MTPKTGNNTYNGAPEDFSEIMELTQEEKRELLKMWKDGERSSSRKI